MKTIVMIGTGSLARHVAGSLTVVGRYATRPDLRLIVAGRSLARSREVAYLANARAILGGRPLATEAVQIDPLSWADHDRLVDIARPDCLLVCASLHSPWEQQQTQSEWSSLLKQAGNAVTLPLQAAVARRAARAAAHRSVPLINACYPDAVNPLLAALGTPPFSGVGNVALIAASLAASLALRPTQRLQVVAHHWHLGRDIPAEDEAMAFVDGMPVSQVGERLAAQRTVARSDLNHVTGLLTAQLVVGLVHRTPFTTHVPGPGGLPGGYPVRVADGRWNLDLPAALDRRQAVDANRRWAARAGAVIDGRRIFYADSVQGACRRTLGDYAAGFDAEAIDEVETRLIAVRDRLRQVPAGLGTD